MNAGKRWLACRNLAFLQDKALGIINLVAIRQDAPVAAVVRREWHVGNLFDKVVVAPAVRIAIAPSREQNAVFIGNAP